MSKDNILSTVFWLPPDLNRKNLFHKKICLFLYNNFCKGEMEESEKMLYNRMINDLWKILDLCISVLSEYYPQKSGNTAQCFSFQKKQNV